MTESEPRKIGYWESMGKIVMSDPMNDTLAMLDVHYATKQEYDESSATTGNTSYRTVDESEVDEEVPYDCLINNKEFDNQDGAEDLLERISKAVPEIMECLESGRVDRAGLKLEEVKLDLDDYNEGDVS